MRPCFMLAELSTRKTTRFARAGGGRQRFELSEMSGRFSAQLRLDRRKFRAGALDEPGRLLDLVGRQLELLEADQLDRRRTRLVYVGRCGFEHADEQGRLVVRGGHI